MSNVLTAASRQWFSRSDDERFLTLESLRDSVAKRRNESWTATPKASDLRVVAGQDNALSVEVFDPSIGDRRMLAPTNLAFGQLATYAKAPAGYLRQLPAELAAINLQYGLEHRAIRDEALVLAHSNGDNSLRAMTSTSYGRIWDQQVVESVMQVNSEGRWKIPAASYATANPKRATTLYASDRDIFIFLVDDAHPIEVPGEKEPLFRGFYTWNSEVGAGVFGIATFLYRYVCDNRMIWGATQVKELRIRHTGGAPERFAYEGSKYLHQYSNESPTALVNQITAAKRFESDEMQGDAGISKWLQKRGFSKAVAVAAEGNVNAEGAGRSLWDIINGVTAHARSIPHTDARVQLELDAGRLMNIVASN